MKIRLGKVGALLGAAVLLSNTAMAGVVAGTAFANSNAPSSATLQPGQTYTVTANITATGSAAGLTFNQIALNPNLASQFQIVGGTCNTTTTQYIARPPARCKFSSRQPAGRRDCRPADGFVPPFLRRQVVTVSTALSVVALAMVATMARFVGSGVAAVVDALGREGLTLAAALFALTAWTSLRRPNQSRTRADDERPRRYFHADRNAINTLAELSAASLKKGRSRFALAAASEIAQAAERNVGHAVGIGHHRGGCSLHVEHAGIEGLGVYSRNAALSTKA